MILRHEGKDVTEIVTKIKWSGDSKQAARVLEFSVAVSASDYYLPVVNFAMEDMVRFLDNNGNEIFQGYIFNKAKSINSSEMIITCYDGLVYMLKSKGTYNFTGMTPEGITQKMADDFGIKTGHLEKGSPLDRIVKAEIIYNIPMTAYSIESAKSNKQFMLKMIEGKLNSIIKGSHKTKFVLDAQTTIVNSNYSESIESSINRVRIYDAEGNAQGEVSLGGISGTLQDIYEAQEGVDSITAATAMLNGIEQTASVEALGDIECVTGNAVIIKEGFTGLDGLFYIDTDTHTWENGQHMMSLGLAYKNIMDYQNGGQDPADIVKEQASNNPSSGGGGVNISINVKPGKGGSSSGGVTNAKGKRGALIAAARTFLGFRYSQPNRFGNSSADCSSLVARAMVKAGITNNKFLTTRSIHSDSRFQRISKSQLQPGDIVWQSGHMALFIGNNTLIEASYSAMRVKYNKLNNRFSYGFRIRGID